MKNIFCLFFALIFSFSVLFSQEVKEAKPDSITVNIPPLPLPKKEKPKKQKSHEVYPVNELEEVVIIGHRTEKKLMETGKSVTVISSDEIKNSGANSLAELLSQYEGIYIAGTQQNYGSNQSIFMRGANSNQTVVMIDGMRITDPSTPNNAIDFSELSLYDIDRIEIVRGSHSMLYGSSAIGGAVNIITRKNSAPGLNVRLAGTAGSFGEGTSFIGNNISVNYSLENGIYFNSSVLNADVNGLNATLDTAAAPLFPPDKDNFNRLDAGGKIGIRNAAWDVFAAYKITETSAEIDDREFTDDDNYILDFNRKTLSYNFAYKTDSGFSVLLNGGISDFTRRAVDDSSVIDLAGNYDQSYYNATYSGNIFSTELQLQIKRRNFNIMFGGGSYNETMNQDIYSYYYGSEWKSNLDSLDLASRTNSFFLLADVNGSAISEKLKPVSVSFGGRSNLNNIFDISTTYQVNPSVQLSNNVLLYGNFASGYNAPSLYQLHSPEENSVSKISRGNINLRPEESVTHEAGILKKINEQSHIRVGYFKTMVSNVIEYVYLWDKTVSVNSLSGSDYRGDTYLNLGRLTSEGAELEILGKLSRKLSVSGNFTFLRGKQHFSWEAIDTVKTRGHHIQLFANGQFLTKDVNTKGLTRRPSTANISAIWNVNKKSFLKATWRFIGERNDIMYDSQLGPFGANTTTPVNAFTLLDIVGGITFTGNISALFKVENLLNVSYTETGGYSTRGRGVFFSLLYNM